MIKTRLLRKIQQKYNKIKVAKIKQRYNKQSRLLREKKIEQRYLKFEAVKKN